MDLKKLVTRLKRQQRETGDEGHRSAGEHSEQTRPESPSYTFRHYNHPSEEEHRTAEQFNWRYSNRLNVGIAIVAVIGALFAALSFCESKRQADIAATTLIQGSRAWIDVTADQTRTALFWREKPEEQFMEIAIYFTNKGTSPAYSLGVLPTVRVEKSGPMPSIEEQIAKNCPSGILNRQTGGGNTVFANDKISLVSKVFLPQKEIAEYRTAAMARFGANSEIPIAMDMLVCAYYGVLGDSKIHRSVRIYDVGTMKPGDDRFYVPRIGQDISLGRIVLRDWGYGEYAD